MIPKNIAKTMFPNENEEKNLIQYCLVVNKVKCSNRLGFMAVQSSSKKIVQKNGFKK